MEITKVKKVLATVFYALVALVAAAYLTLQICAEQLQMDWAISIQQWLYTKYEIVVSGAGAAVFVMVMKYASTLKQKSDQSMAKVADVTQELVGAKEQLSLVIADYKAERERRIEQDKVVADLKQEMADFSKAQDAKTEESIELQKLVRDILLCYTFKTSSDQTIQELTAAFKESELLKHIQQLQVILKEDIPEEVKVEVKNTVAAAKRTVKEAVKAIQVEKKRLA